MTDQVWGQAPESKPADPKNKWIVAVMAVVLLVILGFGMFAQSTADTEPSRADARDVVWADMTTSERVDFCAEARAAGYEVVSAEMSNGTRKDQREARWWLEDRCG